MIEYPLNKAFMLIEPGPVILVTTAGEDPSGHPNVMTITWKTVVNFSPRFALSTGPWNYTFLTMMENRECVISVPTVEMSETVVKIGSCSSKDVDKFKEFGLTAVAASEVGAPLIAQCYANLECTVVDYVDEFGIVILDCVKAWIDEKQEHPRFFHAVGDGTFTVDGETISHREIMGDKLPPGV
jgi:flavin reductase (DIM6/NTAB) family NADH-FMN oxidoreductase RutF